MFAAKLGVKFSQPVMWWLATHLTLGPSCLWGGIFGPDSSAGLAFNGAGLLRPLLCIRGLFLPAKHRNSQMVDNRTDTCAGASFTAGFGVSVRGQGGMVSHCGVGAANELCLAVMLRADGLVPLSSSPTAGMGSLHLRCVLLAVPVAPSPSDRRVQTHSGLAH